MMNDLVNIVFGEIGLELDREYNIVDQDTGVSLMMNGKFIKYYFGNNPQFIDNNDKIFNPFEDPYLMNFLVSYYIDKLKNENPDLYIYTYHPIINKSEETSALELKGSINYTSRYYKNECLKFIDVIMKLSGDENIDLSLYDIVQ